MLPVKRTRGGTQPGPLSRQDIVTAALPLLAEHGIDGLTMKAVADALGISSPALYHHFENRDALLDRLAERVAAEVDTTVAARMTWDDAIVAVILEMHRAFTRYPGLAARVMRDRHPSPAAARRSAAVPRHNLPPPDPQLPPQPAPPRGAHSASHLFISHITAIPAIFTTPIHTFIATPIPSKSDTL